ncbi:cytochrome P450 [Sorangium sp. So ce861]|uniref:cytochrome P450 n=1 Tax=Sorangium sp. So ce861 TaxID=3133323 RepID=UPI003F646906
MVDATVTESGNLPFLDVLSPEFVRDPGPMLRACRREHWMARSPIGFEVLGFPESVSMLRDERIRPGFDKLLEILGITSGPAHEHMSQQVGSQEGDAHRRIRRLIQPAFSIEAMERLRAPARQVVDTLLDAVDERGACDFVAHVSGLFPGRLFCRLLNVSEADAAPLARMNGSIMKMFWMKPEYRGEVEAAIHELGEYSLALVERRRREPGEDFVSGLILAEEQGDRLSTQELIDLVRLTLTAAVDNVNHTLSLMVLLLAERPGAWQQLRARPELIPRAVEECMRYRPRVLRLTHYAAQDTVLGGVPIPAGSWVMSVVAEASRDERVFSDPDRFDITREPVRPNLNFGTGRHNCIGAYLAQIELQEALSALVERWESIEIAGEVVPQASNQTNGVLELPLRWKRA